ncbi:hypothetical protein [Actinoplanes sp. L3-i22]|uniref:hypothetical protein n=1 Tax=Actinoplanes sp. L3-i22 TaxID=2836373 RepID=UPI001C791E74|nr:hypothetical protein [Actinoplanes sp. L3-i22]BCY10924.1 hypothetical protein L3i22_060120 [Actinoplanes sp. L3-i22]
MLLVYVTVATTWMKARAREARRDDGALSVEQVVITVALLLAAVALAAVITAAIKSRSASIV